VGNVVGSDSVTKVLTFFEHNFFNITLGFSNIFLDTRRLNPTVFNETFEGNASYFTPNSVVARETDYSGSFVHIDINPSHFFKGTDITAIFTNNSAFNFVIGNFDGGDRKLGDIFGGSVIHGVD